MYIPNLQGAATLGLLRASASGVHRTYNTDSYAARTPPIISRYVVNPSDLPDLTSNTASNCPSHWSWNSTAKECQKPQNTEDDPIMNLAGFFIIYCGVLAFFFAIIPLIYTIYWAFFPPTSEDHTTEYHSLPPSAPSNINRTNIRISTRVSAGISARISPTRRHPARVSRRAVATDRHTMISLSYGSSRTVRHTRNRNPNSVFASIRRNAGPLDIVHEQAHALPAYAPPERQSSQDAGRVTPPPRYRMRARDGEHVFEDSDVTVPAPAYRRE